MLLKPLGQVGLCSDVLLMGKDILWLSVILLQVRLPCLFKGSLVPAAMIIPAPLTYIKVVAVKKLILSLFVEKTKLKSYFISYHPMQKA